MCMKGIGEAAHTGYMLFKELPLVRVCEDFYKSHSLLALFSLPMPTCKKIKVIFLLFQLELVTTFLEGYTSFWVTLCSGNSGSLRV